jgi:hypothetical protein
MTTWEGEVQAMIVEFYKVNIVATKAGKKVVLNVADKLRLTFHNKSLEEGTLTTTT